MSWRLHKDPWQEAERLEVLPIIKRMGWSKRRLTSELDHSGSPEFFVKRVTKLAQDLDAPRLLHKDPAKPHTSNPALAAKAENELVSAEYEAELVKQNNAKDQERAAQRNADRKKESIVRRLATARQEAAQKAVDISAQEKIIARQLDRIESRLDKVAA